MTGDQLHAFDERVDGIMRAPTPAEVDDLLADVCATGYASEAAEVVERWIEVRFGVVGAVTARERKEAAR